MMKCFALWMALAIAAVSIAGCGGGSGSGDKVKTPTQPETPPASPSSTPSPDGGSTTRHLMIEPGADATDKAVRAFVSARPGDVIEFDCGFFDITKTLQLSHTEDVTIKGCGMNKTVLSFRNNNAPEGILIVNAQGITVKGLTVADTHGDGFTLRNVDHGTLDHVRAFWSSGGGPVSDNPINKSDYQQKIQVACTQPAFLNPDAPENTLLDGTRGSTSSPDYTVSSKVGRYGIYPVKSSNILITHSEAIGASDAGIYVGQDNNSKIVYSRAAYNVFGLEIENVRHGEFAHDLAECNTGGFLVYNLDNLTRYGQRSSMHDNISRMNNGYNFATGGIVSNVPPGTGMLTLAYDGIDIYNNQFIDNNTAGIIHLSYDIFPKSDQPNDNKLDFYSEGIHLWNNTFKGNGNKLPLPTSTDLEDTKITHILPLVIGLKNELACLQNSSKCPGSGSLLRGADIIWDGYTDDYNADCPYPTGADGKPIPKDTPYYPDKPRFDGTDPQPGCHYNGYKFTETTSAAPQRKVPRFYIPACIDHDNTFDGNSIKYANFHGTHGLELLLTALGDQPVQDLLDPTKLMQALQGLSGLSSDLDMYPAHDCMAKFGKEPRKIPDVTIPAFVPNGEYTPAAPPEEIAKLCNADIPAGQVNFKALLKVDCPRLDQYHLFANEGDPTSTPNGPRSFPYVLNTKLFSDYAVKYRVVYLPPNTHLTYNAPGQSKPVGAIKFPLGAAIAKTFSFEKNGKVHAAETRLLIKRKNPAGQVRWKGLPYVWTTDDSGNKVAKLTPEGATLHEAWNFEEIDTGERVQGTTEHYSVPTENQCLTCHSNNNRPGGSAPIGPKVRNMNRPYLSEVVGDTSGQAQAPILGHNQIAWLCNNGWMVGCPTSITVDPTTKYATDLPRLAKYDVPGDSGFSAGSNQDIQARSRAFLEANCAHCHNPQGFASSTGLFLNHYRPVDNHYGICKTPEAAGNGTGGRKVDIHPGSAQKSILAFRIGPGATQPQQRMPPIERSVVDAYAHTLINDWINNVVDSSYAGAQTCTANSGQ